MAEIREKSDEMKKAMTRRNFLKKSGLLALTAGAAEAGVLTAPSEAAETRIQPEWEDVAGKSGGLERMQQDLLNSLKKPVDQRRWGMVIDLRKCVGCKTCVVTCKAENHTPPEVDYNRVDDEEIGTYPNVKRRFISQPCMQCENPSCIKRCPTGATYRRPDGVVVVDYEKCIRALYCVIDCPYAARSIDLGEFYHKEKTPYETVASPEYGEHRPRKKETLPIGVVRKCTFCLHRVHKGLLPACAAACMGRAIFFGDLKDPKSLVSEMVAELRPMRLKEETGNQPSVYYVT